MRAVTFYRWSLVMPVAIPLFCSLAFLAPNSEPGKVLVPVAQFLLYSLFLGGVSYLVTLATFSKTLRADEEEDIRHLTWVLPLLMAAIQFAVGCIAGFFAGVFSGGTFWNTFCGIVALALITVPFILALGYVYVLVAHGLFCVLRYAELIEAPETKR